MQCCCGLIQMLSYEAILSITVYLPPMFFMAGPATIVVADSPWVTLLLNAIIGFALSWVLHRMGHRLLAVLPNEPKVIYLSTSLHLPVKLTLTQFVWTMELIVAAAVFSGLVGRRLFLVGGVLEVLLSILCLAVGLGLYFLPVYLGRFWIKRYYSVLDLLRPTEEIVSRCLLRQSNTRLR